MGTVSSCFYGRWQHRREEITDSGVSAGGSNEKLLALITEVPAQRQFHTV